MLSIGTARGGALPYLAIYRSASVGRSLAGRPAGAGLLANFSACAALLRLLAAAAQPKAAASNSISL